MHTHTHTCARPTHTLGGDYVLPSARLEHSVVWLIRPGTLMDEHIQPANKFTQLQFGTPLMRSYVHSAGWRANVCPLNLSPLVSTPSSNCFFLTTPLFSFSSQRSTSWWMGSNKSCSTFRIKFQFRAQVNLPGFSSFGWRHEIFRCLENQHALMTLMIVDGLNNGLARAVMNITLIVNHNYFLDLQLLSAV